jgi:hypothetical protein
LNSTTTAHNQSTYSVHRSLHGHTWTAEDSLFGGQCMNAISFAGAAEAARNRGLCPFKLRLSFLGRFPEVPDAIESLDTRHSEQKQTHRAMGTRLPMCQCLDLCEWKQSCLRTISIVLHTYRVQSFHTRCRVLFSRGQPWDNPK